MRSTSKKKTTSQFILEVNAKYGINEYEILSEYTGSNDLIKWKHLRCGRINTTTASDLLRGRNKCKCLRKSRSKSNEQFKLELLEKNPKINPLSEYKKATTKIEVQCRTCGHIWSSKPTNLLSGYGCPVCAGNIKKTTEEFAHEVKSKLGEEYTLLSEYVNNHTCVKIQHIACGHIYSTVPSVVLGGHGCPKCNGGVRYDEVGFINKLKSKHNKDYILLDTYIDNDTPIYIKSIECGHAFKIKPKDILVRDGCPDCYAERVNALKKKNSKRIDDALRGEYDIKIKFSNFKTRMKIVHKQCGNEFDCYPSNLLKNGHRCPICYSHKNAKTHEAFECEVKERLGNSVSLLGKYTGAKEKILVKHNACGTEYLVTPSSLLNGNKDSAGCPICSHAIVGEKHRISKKLCKQMIENIGLIFEDGRYPDKTNTLSRSEVLYKCPKHIEEGVQSVCIDRLTSNKMCGCPKCSISKGELKISSTLSELNVPYVSQKKFDDLRGVNGGMLSYDFYLPNHNVLIEFQGEQHEKESAFFCGSENSNANFKKQQEHDKRKREYAKNNGINLLEIWYRDINKISDILINYLALGGGGDD